MAGTVKTRWYARWNWYEKGLSARRAHERAKVAKDYTKDLSPQEQALIVWSETETDG